MKMRIIKMPILLSLILVAVIVITGCEGVTPVEDPFIEVISPREEDIIDGKNGYIEIEWVANNLRTSNIYIDFACAYYSKDCKGDQIGDWERIGNVPASDEYFKFGPDIASWIIDVFGVVPDMCRIKLMEAVGSEDPGFEWVWANSGTFKITFE